MNKIVRKANVSEESKALKETVPIQKDWYFKVERKLTEEGFEIQSMPLKSKPTATHLHARHKVHRGTIELTAEGAEIIIEVRSNRASPKARELAL